MTSGRWDEHLVTEIRGSGDTQGARGGVSRLKVTFVGHILM